MTIGNKIMNDLLSIIVPIYNVAQYLPRCIHSILGQSYQNIELILVNDGSTDHSLELIEEIKETDSRIVVLSQSNKGVSSARNKGLSYASGPYIAFVDPDDYVHKSIYSEMMNILDSQNHDIVFCRFQTIDSNHHTIKFFEKGLQHFTNNITSIQGFFNPPTGLSTDDSYYTDKIMGVVWRSIFKKSIIDQFGLTFNENVHLSEDLIFILAYLSHCDHAGLIDEYLYYYYIRENSAMREHYKDGLYPIRRECLLAISEILNLNNHFSYKEKNRMFNKFRIEAGKEIISNELRFNANYFSELKKLTTAGFFREFLPMECMIQMLHDKNEIGTIILLLLSKLRLWKSIKLLYYLKSGTWLNRNHGLPEVKKSARH